jgi:3D (Asp-Asp-Asp) domain-containing protein
MTKVLRPLTIGLTILAVGCAENGEKGKLSGGNGKVPVGERKVVKTTAYTDSESGHRRCGVKNAIGSHLQSGIINSAAADWSRFPVGTRFRIVDTNQMFVIDDYGPALVGTDTIDLYVPSRRLMDQWGAKRVTIEVFEKGSYEKSLQVLEPRQANWCCRQMVQNIRKQNQTNF